MHLEDQLQSIYLKSKLLAEYIKVHHRVFSHELASLHEYVHIGIHKNTLESVKCFEKGHSVQVSRECLQC